MVTKLEALELVSRKLREMSSPADPFTVVDAGTIERPFGWVFFYNSKKFLETGDYRYQLAGNGPVMVNRYDGTVQFYGTAKPAEEFIDEYEQRLSGEHKGHKPQAGD